MDAPTLAAALAARMARPAEAEALAGIAIDELLAAPLAEVVDATELSAAILELLGGAGRSLALHAEPVVAAETARAAQSGETLEAWVPDEVRACAVERLGRPWDLPAGWTDGIVEPAFVRAILADALADLLEEFVGSLPLAGAAGSLIGSITRRAGRMDGRKVPFAAQARDFGRAQADRLRDRILERLMAPENARELRATIDRGAAAVLGLPTARALGLLDDPGVPVASGWVRDVLAHNVARPEVREAVRAQIAAVIEREIAEAKTIAGLLEASGGTATIAAARAALARRIASVAATPAFAAWLEALCRSAMESP